MQNKKLVVNWKHHPCQITVAFEPLLYLENFWRISVDFDGFPAIRIDPYGRPRIYVRENLNLN